MAAGEDSRARGTPSACRSFLCRAASPCRRTGWRNIRVRFAFRHVWCRVPRAGADVGDLRGSRVELTGEPAKVAPIGSAHRKNRLTYPPTP